MLQLTDFDTGLNVFVFIDDISHIKEASNYSKIYLKSKPQPLFVQENCNEVYFELKEALEAVE